MANVSQPLISGPLLGTLDPDTLYAFQAGIKDAQIDTRAGDDTINGTDVNDNGIGIFNSVITGDAGNDTLIGNATGANSVGVVDSILYGGSGNDVIIAIGTSAGIQGAVLAGGPGDDIFSVQSGTGVIVGETGNDTIILSGSRADYTLTPLDEINTVIEITGISNGTLITTAQLEVLQFDDATIPVDEIFV